ncbi:DUF3499 family protein [Tropheryma whipplei]|nr:DUF3499 family protein [Tropheryma whipplei]
MGRKMRKSVHSFSFCGYSLCISVVLYAMYICCFIHDKLNYMKRVCSRPACTETASFSFVYDPRERFVTVGPMSEYHMAPECFDVCRRHAKTLNAPKGWTLFKHSLVFRA